MPVTERSVVTDGESNYRVTERPPWSPAQLVAVAAGVVLVVIGGVALARGGIHFDAVPFTHSTVIGLHFTCMSALIQLVAGVLLLGGGAYPDAASPIFFSRRRVVSGGGTAYADPQYPAGRVPPGSPVA